MSIFEKNIQTFMKKCNTIVQQFLNTQDTPGEELDGEVDEFNHEIVQVHT